jgi:hypothetical protein
MSEQQPATSEGLFEPTVSSGRGAPRKIMRHIHVRAAVVAVVASSRSAAAQQRGSPASAGAVKKGETVLALGRTNGTTITASQVIVQPNGSAGSATSPTAVVPFERGAPSTSKQVGQIAATYSQGSGTIVSGTSANKATEAALAAYPGALSTGS